MNKNELIKIQSTVEECKFMEETIIIIKVCIHKHFASLCFLNTLNEQKDVEISTFHSSLHHYFLFFYHKTFIMDCTVLITSPSSHAYHVFLLNVGLGFALLRQIMLSNSAFSLSVLSNFPPNTSYYI